VRIGQPRATLFVLRVTPVFLLLHSQGQQVWSPVSKDFIVWCQKAQKALEDVASLFQQLRWARTINGQRGSRWETDNFVLQNSASEQAVKKLLTELNGGAVEDDRISDLPVVEWPKVTGVANESETPGCSLCAF
jgi:hypothetical protein